LLEGKLVNLRIMEREDLPILLGWNNRPEFYGENLPLIQQSKTDLEKAFDKSSPEAKMFFVEKKDGTKIGNIGHFLTGHFWEIGYVMTPEERGKGYCSEAVKIMVDYLFLSKEMERIQAATDVGNVASQKVLEKVGFKKEGTIRKSAFFRGKWRDWFLYSILREEWKEPKILTRTEKK
jgi:RimJ/RimL family protein N-acetyltransferase